MPVLHHKRRKHQLFAVYTYGQPESYFQFRHGKPPSECEAKRMELLHGLNAVGGTSLPDDAVARRPSMELVGLREKTVQYEFPGVLDWVVDQVRRG